MGRTRQFSKDDVQMANRHKRMQIKTTIRYHLILVTEKAMAPHSSTLAWKILWTEEPGGLQSTGSQRVRHD